MNDNLENIQRVRVLVEGQVQRVAIRYLTMDLDRRLCVIG